MAARSIKQKRRDVIHGIMRATILWGKQIGPHRAACPFIAFPEIDLFTSIPNNSIKI
jgi:hypothetical protein